MKVGRARTSPPARKVARSRTGLGEGLPVWIVPGLIALLCSAPSLRGSFVWDDWNMIVGNEAAHSWSGLIEALRHGYGWAGSTPAEAGDDVRLYYRPLVTLLSGAQWILSGGAAWPFHLLNMLLHGATAGLVTVLASRHSSRRSAVVAGGLFALHPVLTEPVAWISGRTDLLSTVCGLASLTALSKALRPDARGARWAGFAAGLLFLALESKESALAFACAWGLLLTLEARYGPGIRPRLRSVRVGLIALIAVVIVSGALRLAVLGHLIGVPEVQAESWGARLREAGSLVATYAARICWPFGLDVEAPGWLAEGAHAPGLAFIGALLSVSWVVLVSRAVARGERESAVALFLVGSGLLPVLQLVPTGERYGERFLYLPVAALAVAAAPLLGRFAHGPPGSILVAVLAVVWFAAGQTRLREWRDERALFGASASRSPHSARAAYHFGSALLTAGDVRASVPVLERAVTLAPEDPRARAQWGVALVKTGRAAEGAAQLARAAELAPGVLAIEKNLGVAWSEAGRLDEARTLLESLRTRAPSDASVVDALAGVHRRMGDHRRAADLYAETIAIDPHRSDAYLNLISLALNELGDRARARDVAQRFVSRFPASPEGPRLAPLLEP